MKFLLVLILGIINFTQANAATNSCRVRYLSSTLKSYMCDVQAPATLKLPLPPNLINLFFYQPRYGIAKVNYAAGSSSNHIEYKPNAISVNASEFFNFSYYEKTQFGNYLKISNTYYISVQKYQAPMASSLAMATNEDSSVQGILRAASAAPLKYLVNSWPSRGTLSVNEITGAFTYSPNIDVNGEDSFTFIAHDGISESNIATVKIAIAPLNDAPVSNNLLVEINENESVFNRQLGAIDPDGDVVSFILVTRPKHGGLKLNDDGTFSYIPQVGYYGQDSFDYAVSDGLLQSGTARVDIKLNLLPSMQLSLLDIDGNGSFNYDDAMVTLRHLFGFSGSSLTSNTNLSDDKRDAVAMKNYLTAIHTALHIDNDGRSDALTDGLLILRYAQGYSGESLISGVINPVGLRNTGDLVQSYMKVLAYDFNNSPWDIDMDGKVDANDAYLVIRYLGQYSGAQLVDGLVTSLSQRNRSEAIMAYLDEMMSRGMFDIDGDNISGPLTDGVIIYRSIIAGIIEVANKAAPSAVRTTNESLHGFIRNFQL